VASLRVGTRGSVLALAQARAVADALGDAELVPITTSGDRGPGDDKSRFVREIDSALLAGEVDLAVHSAKDVPGELPEGVEILAVPRREDPADAFVGRASSLDELSEGARVGTSSLRRRAQLLALRPDLDVRELRGNVDTRLRKLAEEDLDGLVLAAAGLERLDRAGEISFRFDEDRMTPAPGQGSLAIEARTGDERVRGAVASLNDPASLAALTAERMVVAKLDASCRTPMGVRARAEDGRVAISAFIGLPDGGEWIRDAITAPGEPAEVGEQLADRLLAAGAADVLARAEGLA
jgi:hydroxymethylbilane synthase